MRPWQAPGDADVRLADKLCWSSLALRALAYYSVCQTAFAGRILASFGALPVNDVLLRTTFIVEDIEAAISFYTGVFGWKVVYDTVLHVDRRFPPAAPDGARSRLVIMQADDPEIGGIGFMRYLDDPIALGPSKTRPRLSQGDAILVIRSDNPDATYDRILSTDAVIHSPPVDWEVPGPRPGQVIRLRTMSLFDPNGIYMEVNLRYPDPVDG